MSPRSDVPSTRAAVPRGMSRFLAFDTSTDVMSIALTDGGQCWHHTGPGGAKASTTLIPAVLALLAQAEQASGLTLHTLDAIVFGQGPGSFTGLRTACAVAQGLAFGARHGAGIAVLPLPTLLAVAEEARFQLAGQGQAVRRITAVIDARMDEIYGQQFDIADGACTPVGSVSLVRPEQLHVHWPFEPDGVLAGNVFGVYAGRLQAGAGLHCREVEALPTAAALLRLAPHWAAAGHCVAADQALPLYVRDKVAQTTAERAHIKAEKLALATATAVARPA